MSDADGDAGRPKPIVFVSYASEDREAARLLGNTLLAHGLEVWLDESELGGGDAWDQKIRKQIRECDYFMALVSAQTEARHEGYFRREWRLAVERTLDMADDHAFLLPVVIDETMESRARVPEKFLSVQWLRLPNGNPTQALEVLCRRLIAGNASAPPSFKKSASRGNPPLLPVSAREFPTQENGRKLKFCFDVAAWVLWSAWALFLRWPRWIRILIIVWLGIVVLSKGCTTTRHRDESDDLKRVPKIIVPLEGGVQIPGLIVPQKPAAAKKPDDSGQQDEPDQRDESNKDDQSDEKR